MSVKEKVKNASLDLFIEYGIHGTSIKMITEKAEISNGAIFHHFPSKDDISIALYKDFKTDLLDSLYNSVLDTSLTRQFIYEYFKANVLWGYNNQKKKMFLEMFSMSPTIRNCKDYLDVEKVEHLNGFIQKAIDLNEIVSIDLEAFLINILAVTDGVSKYLVFHAKKDVDEIIDFMFKQYYRSIVNF